MKDTICTINFFIYWHIVVQIKVLGVFTHPIRYFISLNQNWRTESYNISRESLIQNDYNWHPEYFLLWNTFFFKSIYVWLLKQICILLNWTGHKSKNWFESKSQMNFNVQKTMYIQVMPTFLEKSKKQIQSKFHP